jgi:hypothetical protein
MISKMGTYTLKDKHLQNVLKLPGSERYDYLIKRSADWGYLYGIRSTSGWALAGKDEGSQLFPVWPHARFAELCLTGDWSDCSVVAIPLSEWLDEINTWLISRDLKVAVFPLPDGRAVTVAPDRLSGDLRLELSKLEG